MIKKILRFPGFIVLTTKSIMSQSVSVVSSQNTTTEVQITAARAQQATKIYKECCKKLAEIIKSDPESYGLSGEVSAEDLIALIPKPTFKVKSKSKTSKEVQA